MYEFYLRLPDEARSLPPPPLLNKGSVYTAFVGWSTALISNAINHRPILAAGVHRQLFYTSVGFYVGHYLMRRASYVFAKRDRDMFEYIERHPEDFKDKEKKKMAEVLENFHPIR
ncbi:NADH dehydrogenase [ubiquinone] 1 subunit C2 [Sphaerodactylus townsendi]|uniref:NADH dehydrogenase [ubiquinone] 1 subunit C2 n=1 Tax=Sphaerodactylus townsendi TaxID=933632 RepID=UPI0020262B55|nr:NADH dehydrogenase [ubiquinone] 1 subunit C2 [Sphaerodactylus townsendi]